MSRARIVEKLEPGDIVIYEPPDLAASDYNGYYINSLGVVTDELIDERRPDAGETHVRWVSSKALSSGPLKRHYTKNLRKLGEVQDVDTRSGGLGDNYP